MWILSGLSIDDLFVSLASSRRALGKLEKFLEELGELLESSKKILEELLENSFFLGRTREELLKWSSFLRRAREELFGEVSVFEENFTTHRTRSGSPREEINTINEFIKTFPQTAPTDSVKISLGSKPVVYGSS